MSNRIGTPLWRGDDFLLASLLFACTLAAQSGTPGAGSIEGRVLDSLSGTAIRKATVILTSAQVRLVANTDSEGRFQFTALPPGTYRMAGSRAGFLDHPARRVIQLGQSDRVADAEIRLPPQSVIAGRVLDEDGEPVDRALVLISKQVHRGGRRFWDRLASSTTNDRGEYRFPSLKPGRYLVSAFYDRPPVDNQYGSAPKASYVMTYYPSAPYQQHALPVDVGWSAEVRGIDIRLAKVSRPSSVHVRGKVTGVPPGSQIVVSVGVYSADGGPFGGASTSANPPDYRFDLTAAPGQYTLSCNVSSGGPEAYGTANISVTGDVDGVVLPISPAPEISGQIRLAEGGVKVNFEGVRIVLARLSIFEREQFELRPDAAGRFVSSRPLRPGRYAVANVRSVPEGCFVREIKLDGQGISPDDFEIVSSGHLEIILSNKAGKIAGTVIDAEGKPFPISTVTLISADGRPWPAKQAADDGGSFLFAGLRPGKYKLFAWEEVDDDVWQDPEFRKDYESRASEVTVGPSETQTVQLRLITAAR